ncbi:MAG TPA: endonuclease/exonuclease/phosphatase family protein [Solirubrobacteraceae bacterium]|nr:endonuclease/exonuclease/phosphatase family protein [Solirubrobacteraceae bacterium]
MRARLLSWNVAGRVKRALEQLERVRDSAADIVCLQEVSPATEAFWRRALSAHGWPHVEVGPLAPARAAGRSRLLAALTAARHPLEVLAVAGLPWPERVLATRVEALEIVNVHSPISQRPGLVKVLTHEAVHAHLMAARGPRLVCGDLNTPRKEHSDGRVWTFARTQHGKLRPERGERWDAAELALIKGLEPAGFRDAFRARHGYDVRELSWEWPRWGGGYRLDHLIVSAEVEVDAISYVHAWRKEGLSDHSALIAEVQWPARAPAGIG